MTVQELIDTLRRLDRQGLVVIHDPFAGEEYDLDAVAYVNGRETWRPGLPPVVRLEAGGRA